MEPLLQSQSTSAWWVEICTSMPKNIYCLGPFNSREEAETSRSAHVNALSHQETRDIVALVKQR